MIGLNDGRVNKVEVMPIKGGACIPIDTGCTMLNCEFTCGGSTNVGCPQDQICCCYDRMK